MHPAAGGERPLVRVQAGEGGQQRGVDVQHAAGPAVHEPGRQQPHVAGEAHQLDTVRGQHAVHRALVRLAVAAERAVVDRRGRHPGLPRPVQRRGGGLVGQHQRDRGREGRVGAARSRAPCCCPVRWPARRRAGGAGSPRCSTARRAGAASVRPMANTVSPAASSRAVAAAASSTTSAMPMPQLNTRSISSGATAPALASQSITGGRGQLRRPARPARRPAAPAAGCPAGRRR